MVEKMEVTGSVTYRERMAAPKGSTAIVRLLDVSLADAPSVTLDKEIIDLTDKSVPVDYSLSYDMDKINPSMRYVVRAEIRGPGDQLMWTTDQSYRVDPKQSAQSMPMIVLKRVESSKTGPALVGETWTVTKINGEAVDYPDQTNIKFAKDGRVSGTAGCNTYTASYSVDGDSLELGQAAVTRKACVPGLDEQEADFLDVFNDVDSYAFDGSDLLKLSTDDGRSITATR